MKELKKCTGCGTLSTEEIKPPALACCPDNNYVTMKKSEKEAIELLQKFMPKGLNKFQDLFEWDKAIVNALIAVDYAIEHCISLNIPYLEQVKEHINKM